MRFVEVDLFGVYVAPISVMMMAAWLVLIALRRVADHFGAVRVRLLHDRALVDRAYHRALRYADVEC